MDLLTIERVPAERARYQAHVESGKARFAIVRSSRHLERFNPSSQALESSSFTCAAMPRAAENELRFAARRKRPRSAAFVGDRDHLYAARS